MTAATAAVRQELMSEEEFLAAEPFYAEKHEFLGGMVHALADASLDHCGIAHNLNGILHNASKGRRFQAFGPGMKVRLSISHFVCFYYPDAMIVCDTATLGPSWCDGPAVLFEVLSESTRSIDEREKRMAYITLPTLEAYVRIEQDRMEVVIDRRAENGWAREILGAEDRVKLPGTEVEFAVAELYERVELGAD